ncbi:hypothetical protein BDA99DRAFT_559540 [Phascolomyces articulosus]|uniref:Major facilitator superfamily (MFS) profile domain-containing protein n=1 Tax=Phascolomyces articulosus TaxID=60185 RepID=A0AAD5K148_9FUNG|nr:hypothetical protein BDA99DRAFT_559540 [Phascolomyces articulosus]
MTEYGSIKTSSILTDTNDRNIHKHNDIQQTTYDNDFYNTMEDRDEYNEQSNEPVSQQFGRNDDHEDDTKHKNSLGTLSFTTLIVCSNIAAWVHTSYLLVTVMVQLLYSKLSSLFGRQPMLVCIASLFLIGSIGCSYATSFSQLLVSRVLAGLGGGGSSVMILTVLHDLLPPRQRSQYQSYTYTMQTLGLVCGSPVGGFITQYLGWRYCFKINIIPFLFALYVFAFRLPNYTPPVSDDNIKNNSSDTTVIIKNNQEPINTITSLPASSSTSLIQKQDSNSSYYDNTKPTNICDSDNIFKKLYSIDFLGAILLGAANATFTTGIMLGGNTRPWTDPFILSMLVMSAIFFLIFGLYEIMGAAFPLVSRLIVSSRNIISICIGSHLFGLGSSVSFYVLPQLFMGILGMEPSRAGLCICVESLSISLGSILTGQYLRHQPRYRNFVLTSTIIYTLAISVLSVWTSSLFPFLLGMTCIFIEGIVSGAFVLSTLLGVGTEIPREEVSIVTSLSVMCRLMGYMNGVAIASAILQGSLKTYLYQHIQGEDVEELLEFIRTSIRKVSTLSPEIQQVVVDGLGLAIQKAFWFAVACTCATFLILAVFMENNSLWFPPPDSSIKYKDIQSPNKQKSSTTK